MPIHFNEGLPRSGKSYSAVKDYIVPALAKGRHVYAFIDGLNVAALSEVAGIAPELGAELLHQLTEDDLKRLPEVVAKDSLAVLDEVQNYWPNGREKLAPAMVKWIAEHGHLGQDILLLGQCVADVHAMWRRRITQKTVFLKMEGVGSAGRYQWSVYKATSAEKYKLAGRSGLTGDAYEAKYFPCYQSFDPATENTTGTLVDKRAIVWNNSAFKVWLPVALVAGVVGAWSLLNTFNPSSKNNAFVNAQASTLEKVNGKPMAGPVAAPVVAGGAVVAPVVQTPSAAVVAPPKESKPVMDEITKGLVEGSPRLAAVMWNKSGKAAGLVELGEKSFTFEALRSLGWELSVDDGLLRGRRGDQSFIASSFTGAPKLGLLAVASGANLVPQK